MTKIVHISDWHGRWSSVPSADVVVVSGDMLEVPAGIPTNKIGNYQREAFKSQFRDNTFRIFFYSPDVPVVVVRGNQEYTDLGPMFGGEVFEISKDSTRTVEYCGLRFGGFRGIKFIAGGWCDEEQEPTLANRGRKLPTNLDVVVTHAPPEGIMDTVWSEHCGLSSLTSYITKCSVGEETDPDITMPKLFCFGHIHDKRGLCKWPAGPTFSNASGTINEIEL